jgi:putative hydrolase of the HAD superfamily
MAFRGWTPAALSGYTRIMRFAAVGFDLDGTLYPAYRLYILAFPRMLPKAVRLAANNAARQRLRSLGADAAHRAALANEEGRLPSDGPSFRSLAASLVAERLGMESDAAAAMIERDFYHGIEELFARIEPYRGLEPALDRMARGALRLGLLSDLPPRRKLELLGLSHRFECALCSEDSGFLKPAKEPFAMLASRLGLPPERILYVGNNPGIDIAGAKAAGMGAALVSRRRVSEADFCFTDWDRLADFALG